MRILADFLFGDEKSLCGLFLFERGGVLAGLEVYGLAIDAPSELPHPRELRPFEAAGPLVQGALPLGPRVVAVEASPEDAHRLLVRFDTGERRAFDLRAYFGLGVFRSLQDPAARCVRVVEGGGGVGWASGPYLSADTLYLRGEPA